MCKTRHWPEKSLFQTYPGQYLNAMRTDSAQFNENVLVGIDSIEPAGEKVGVRLIAGSIARRIVPWISRTMPYNAASASA